MKLEIGTSHTRSLARRVRGCWSPYPTVMGNSSGPSALPIPTANPLRRIWSYGSMPILSGNALPHETALLPFAHPTLRKLPQNTLIPLSFSFPQPLFIKLGKRPSTGLFSSQVLNYRHQSQPSSGLGRTRGGSGETTSRRLPRLWGYNIRPAIGRVLIVQSQFPPLLLFRIRSISIMVVYSQCKSSRG